MSRHFRTPAPAEPSVAFEKKSAEQLAGIERTTRAALASAGAELVRRQLKAGAHTFTFGQAMVAAMALDVPAHLVKPGYRDTSRFKLREAR